MLPAICRPVKASEAMPTGSSLVITSPMALACSLLSIDTTSAAVACGNLPLLCVSLGADLPSNCHSTPQNAPVIFTTSPSTALQNWSKFDSVRARSLSFLIVRRTSSRISLVDGDCCWPVDMYSIVFVMNLEFCAALVGDEASCRLVL